MTYEYIQQKTVACLYPNPTHIPWRKLKMRKFTIEVMIP